MTSNLLIFNHKKLEHFLLIKIKQPYHYSKGTQTLTEELKINDQMEKRNQVQVYKNCPWHITIIMNIAPIGPSKMVCNFTHRKHPSNLLKYLCCGQGSAGSHDKSHV